MEAEHYKPLCKNYDVFGLDYKGSTPWETKEEFQREFDALAAKYDKIILIANSIGAYFAMNALTDRNIEKALFISPIVDMEKLITDMMSWEDVSETTLRKKGEISTNFGENLSWSYLCYVRKNPLRWNVPTEILYAGQDNLISRETVAEFAKKQGAGLTVMENGEHWFHADEQMQFLDGWVKEEI